MNGPVVDVAPTLRDVNLTIYRETAPSTVIGNILQNRGDSAITLVSTSKESPFNIDANGDIGITSSLFSETNDSFSLEVEASNSFGVSNKATLNIILITTPVLDDSSLKAFDSSSPLTQIGKLSIINNGNDIQSISLSGNGSGDFTVDTDGTIRVAQGVTLQASRQDYYNLTVLINEIYQATLTINVHHRIIGSIDTSGYAQNVTLSVDGTKAYVVDGDSGLQIIDITDPTAPTKLGSFDISGYAIDVTLTADGTKAYVTDGNSGLQVIDIIDPNAPTRLGSFDTPYHANIVKLSADGTKAYVADGNSGLQIIDVSGLEAPQKIPNIKGFSSTVEATLAEGSFVGAIRVYYAGESGITSFRLEGERAEDFSIDAQGNISLEKPLQAMPNNIYTLKAVATNSIGEREADVTIRVHSVPEIINPFNASINSMTPAETLVGKLEMLVDDNTSISYISLSGEGSENFYINRSGEIYVSEEAELHHFVKANYELEVTAINSYGSNTFLITIDVKALIASFLNHSSSTRGVALSTDGTKAYVADGNSGLQIIGITDPAAPTRLGSFDISALDVTLSADGTKAYVADHTSGLQIIGITDPTAPTRLGSFDTPGRAYGVTLSADGTKAYVADDKSGLQIIDITDPTAPTRLGSFDTSGYAYGVTLSADGTKAYVADYTSGLQIIDITDPTAPTRLGSFDTPGIALGVTLSADGTKAYVADGNLGLQIIDLTGL